MRDFTLGSMLPVAWCFHRDCRSVGKVGGRGGTRTRGPLLAKQVLSQLSYTPIAEVPSILRHLPPRVREHVRRSRGHFPEPHLWTARKHRSGLRLIQARHTKKPPDTPAVRALSIV
jgi:hypothetical protein